MKRPGQVLCARTELDWTAILFPCSIQLPVELTLPTVVFLVGFCLLFLLFVVAVVVVVVAVFIYSTAARLIPRIGSNISAERAKKSRGLFLLDGQ